MLYLQEELEDLLDLELTKNEGAIPWANVKDQLFW